MKYEIIRHLSNFFRNDKRCQIKTYNFREKNDLRSSLVKLSILSNNHGCYRR